MATHFTPDWMMSDQLQLSVKGQDTKLMMHKGLLDKLSVTFGSSKDFKEGRENHYIFEDTTETTVMQFIEWAYTGDYSLVTRSLSWPSEDEHDNDLITHARVYIFSDIYNIDKLKDLALTYLMENIRNIAPVSKESVYGGISSMNKEQPEKMEDTRLRDIVALYNLCFNRLRDDDKLLVWLGRFTAWRIRELCQDPAFLAILPQMSSFIFPTVNRACKAPWNSRNPFSHETPIFQCNGCKKKFDVQEYICPNCGSSGSMNEF